MTITVFGKAGCGICESVKDKLGILNLSFDYVDIEQLAMGWRGNGVLDALAWYYLHDTLPAIRIDGVFMTYPEAMKKLKGG